MSSNSLTISYPSEILGALNQKPEEFEREARMLLAIKLYETGKLSSGLAAEVAGFPRSQFLVMLGQYGISPFGTEPDELEQDLADVEAACRNQ